MQTIDAVVADPTAGTVTLRGTLIKEDARPDRLLSKLGDLEGVVVGLSGAASAIQGGVKTQGGVRARLHPASESRLSFAFRWEDEVPGVMRTPGGRRRSVGLNQISPGTPSIPTSGDGLGEQYSSAEHRGKRVPIITAEQGIGRGKQPLTFTFNRLFMGSGGSWHTTTPPSALCHEQGAIGVSD